MTGSVVFPLSRYRNVLGRADPGSGHHPEIDLTHLGLGRTVSRRHTEVDYRDGDFLVQDLGGRLGTYVNGEPLAPGNERLLLPGDTVTIGPVTLTLVLDGPWPQGVVAEWRGETGADTISASTILDGELPLVGQLPQALGSGELTLHYQPQVVLATGEVRSVEALLRWEHPVQGMVSPDLFIPFAENTGFVRNLTTFAVRTAAEQSRAWRERGEDVIVGVNVSTRDLDDPTFADRVVDTIRETAARPGDVLLEVTESGVMADPEHATRTLQELRDAGFHLAIDDFGVGESSLGYLSRLPVHEVKLDRAFAMNLDARTETVVRRAIEMSHELGLRVVAEGVESEDAERTLRRLGCDKGQGYHFGRPVPAEELELS